MFDCFSSLFRFCTKATQWHGKESRNGDKALERPKKAALSTLIGILILLKGPLAISSQIPSQHAQMTSIMPINSEERFLLRRAFVRKFGLDALIGSANEGQKQGREVPRHIWTLFEKQNANPEAESIRHYAVSAHVQEDGIVWLMFNLSATGRNAEKERILRAELKLPKEKETKGMMVHKVEEMREKPGRDGIELGGRDAVEVANLLEVHPTEQEKLVLAWSLPRGRGPLADELLESVALTVFTNSEKYDDGKNIWGKEKGRKKRSAVSSSQRTNSKSRSNENESGKSSISSSRGRKHRTHRKAGGGGSQGQHQQCRRMGLYVDFRELNWNDWIIAPAGYEAYQCRGRCAHPLPAKLNTTNHAIVQSLIHSLDPDYVPAPSCVPVQMSAISILYKDINNVIVVKTYADMRVDACGCH